MDRYTNMERIFFRVHAVQRMAQRKIGIAAVRAVLSEGEVIEEYPHEPPYTNQLKLGWVGSRPLHVVKASDEQEGVHIVITVYEPDAEQWKNGFTRRVE